MPRDTAEYTTQVNMCLWTLPFILTYYSSTNNSFVGATKYANTYLEETRWRLK